MSTIDEAGVIDPITFEVVRNKLAAITDEQAITLKSASGSPVVVEATDFNNGLYLTDGSIVTMGMQVLYHTGTMSTVIKGIIERFGETGIGEGDMFIVNDPYRGAIHQPDVSIVAPIFHEGRHVAWAGSCAHQLDVGGMSFGSWAVGATEIQQEAMLLPGLKLVEGGELRDDLWQMIMGMTRLPEMVGLDLKAMIAANTVATRRLGELMDRYGADTVEAIMLRDIEISEHRFRARLAELPDGVFRAIDFLEHDGHENRLYQIAVTVTKTGEELTIDMDGSSAQAPGFINCTRSGLVGGLFTAMLPILAPDIRWNEGIMRPVTISAGEGLICNATWPAPVSAGTVSAVWVVTNAATAAFSRLAAFGASTRSEAPAVTKGSMWVLTLAGRDRDGDAFGTFLLDSTIGGAGAYVDHDGLDASGEYPVPRPAVANVESNENAGPYLYLYRRLLTDTAGPGRMRGGAAAAVAVTPHDTEALQAMLIGHGVEVPNSTGQFGGFEGSCNQAVLRRTDGAEPVPIGKVDGPDALAALPGAERLGPKPGHFPLHAGDVLAYGFQGGGGYGDPIERDPGWVARDVANGMVGKASAARHYGVILAGAEVDETATEDRRLEIRRARLGGRQPAVAIQVAAVEAGADDIGGAFTLSADDDLHCARCGHHLGPAQGDFKRHAARRRVGPEDHGMRMSLHADLELREWACPECAALLEAEVARHDAASLVSFELATVAGDRLSDLE
jgi:N-methylhydantoinase B